MGKTLNNTDTASTKKNVSDVIIFGDPDVWVLICKASSKSEGWMKSTKAMEVDGLGVELLITTQQEGNIAETSNFIAGARIDRVFDANSNKIISAKVVKDDRINRGVMGDLKK